jgi:hypothetical protein
LSFNRRELIQNRLIASKNKGHSINFGTLTLPRGVSVNDSIKALNSAYNSIISNGLRQYCKRRGITEYEHTRSIDLTICDTDKYWNHIHIHFLLITDKVIDGIKDYIWRRYKSFMDKLSIKVTKMAFDFKPIEGLQGIQNYLNKHLSFELTSTKKKGKKANSYGFMEWLGRIASNPTKRQVAIYRQLVRDTKGTRWFSKSNGFEVSCQFLKDNEMKEEQPIEVFSQEIGINCWIAINEITKVKVMMNRLLKDRVNNPDKEHLTFDTLVEVLKKSTYEQLYSERLVNYYKDKLCEVLKIERPKDNNTFN